MIAFICVHPLHPWRQILRFEWKNVAAIAVAMMVVGVAAVRLHVHISSGQPLIYGAVTVSMLILLLSASYQLGTNLPVLDQASLDSGERATSIRVHQKDAIVYTQFPSKLIDAYFSRRVTIAGDHLIVGDHALPTPVELRNCGILTGLAVCQSDPQIVFRIGEIDDRSPVTTLRITSATGDVDLASPIVLGKIVDHQPNMYLAEVGDTLYVYGDRLIAFDITDPVVPRLISDQPMGWHPQYLPYMQHPGISLPIIPGLSARDRLQKAVAVGWWGDVFDGTYWCFMINENEQWPLMAYRLVHLTPATAEFTKVGSYYPTLVQMMLGSNRYGGLATANGLLYSTSNTGGVSVFDLTRDSMPLIAHFAAPQLTCCEPLPDGRAIAGGEKLWLLGAPRR